MFVDATGVDPEVGQTVQGSLIRAKLYLPITAHVLTLVFANMFDENLFRLPSV
jgi:hypothetical protein